jgi:hypothetical protein
VSHGIQDHDGGADQQTRYEALRQAYGFIASQADLNGVLENLARFLPSVVSFEFLGVALHDPERQVSLILQRVCVDVAASPLSYVVDYLVAGGLAQRAVAFQFTTDDHLRFRGNAVFDLANQNRLLHVAPPLRGSKVQTQGARPALRDRHVMPYPTFSGRFWAELQQTTVADL